MGCDKDVTHATFLVCQVAMALGSNMYVPSHVQSVTIATHHHVQTLKAHSSSGKRKPLI